MDSELRNLLYQRPELYERVYADPGHAVPKMCDACPAALLQSEVS